LIADGGDTITSWSVVRGYRADMMAEGHQIAIWVSGHGRRRAKGILGI
jgi:hypothetical protein